MRTGNPVLSNSTFRDVSPTGTARMTLTGTVHATLIFGVMLFASAMFTWNKATVDPAGAMIWVTGGGIAGLVLALITVFKKEWSGVTGGLYAIAEGLFLGGISAHYEAQFHGIVLQAVLLTGGTLFALLAAYSMRLIRATENFKLGVAAATGGIFLVYLTTWILGFFGVHIPWIHESGMIGIGFSVFVVVLAALNLVLDFDFIEHGCEQGAPKYMEWFAAFGLLVTLVWLYVEILRLLSKLARRD